MIKFGTGGGGGGPRQSPYDGDAPTYFPSATRDTAVEVSVGNGAEANGIDIQYRGDKGFAISGKITGAVADTNSGRGGFGGAGDGGIAVTLSHAATGTFINRTFVQSRDGNNSYSMYGVPNGEYEIVCWKANWRIAKMERDPEWTAHIRMALKSPVEKRRTIRVEAGRISRCEFNLRDADFE